MCKYYRLTSGLLLAIIILLNNSIGIQNMSSQRCYIKTRRENGMTVSEAYAYGNSWKDQADHGDAIGIMVVSDNIINSRHACMVKLCNQGIIPVTQVNGLVLCFPDGNGGIEMISDCA